jgi:hypothetical protein
MPCLISIQRVVAMFIERVGQHTKLRGPERGVYYELFVIIDIYSRYVVGWMVAERETGELAEAFIAEAFRSQGIERDQLWLHADRGTSMTSKPVAQLLVDLGVIRSHSRPHVSNDNPYSEAQFKTLKYCPAFPDRFGSIQDARTFCAAFFTYYNHEHRHSGIGLHTPASVHYGTAAQIREQRAVVLDAAYNANPTRFGHRRPEPPKLPTIAWINEPSREALIQSTTPAITPGITPGITPASPARDQSHDSRRLTRRVFGWSVLLRRAFDGVRGSVFGRVFVLRASRCGRRQFRDDWSAPVV